MLIDRESIILLDKASCQDSSIKRRNIKIVLKTGAIIIDELGKTVYNYHILRCWGNKVICP